MARRDDVAAVLKLMRDGLKFESYNERGYEAPLWKWISGDDVRKGFKTEIDAVNGFCEWYSQIRVVKDVPRPAPFDLDAFMMDGIQALCLAAAEEMRTRGQEFDAEAIAGELVRMWHMIAAIKCGLLW